MMSQRSLFHKLTAGFFASVIQVSRWWLLSAQSAQAQPRICPFFLSFFFPGQSDGGRN